MGTPNNIIDYGYDKIAWEKGGYRWKVQEYVYDKFSLNFTGEALIGISIYDTEYMTSKGISIGDTKARVIELYGENYDEYRPGILTYDDDRENIMLAFEYKAEKVEAIKFHHISADGIGWGVDIDFGDFD